MERWTLLSFALIVAYAVIASQSLYFTIRRRILPDLAMFRVYLGFVAISSTAGIILRTWASNKLYARVYWINDFTHDAILCALGIQLIASLMPKRFVVLWSLAFVTLLVLTFARILPTNNFGVLWSLANLGDFAALVILVGMMFFPCIEWGWHRGMITAGMVCTALGNIVPGWEWAHGGAGILLQYATQAAPLGGMVIFLIASMNESSKGRAAGA